MPLGKKLLRDKTWEISTLLIENASTDRDYLAKLAQYLCDRDLKSGRVAIIIRRVRAVTLDRHSVTLDLTQEDFGLLADYLTQDALDRNSATLCVLSSPIGTLLQQ